MSSVAVAFVNNNNFCHNAGCTEAVNESNIKSTSTPTPTTTAFPSTTVYFVNFWDFVGVRASEPETLFVGYSISKQRNEK